MKITKEQLKQIIQEELEEGLFDKFRKKSPGKDKPSDEFLAHQFMKNLEKTKMGKRSAGVSVKHDPEYAKAYARGPAKKIKEEDMLETLDNNEILKEDISDDIIQIMLGMKPLVRRLDILKKKAQTNPIIMAQFYTKLQNVLLPDMKINDLFAKMSAAGREQERDIARTSKPGAGVGAPTKGEV